MQAIYKRKTMASGEIIVEFYSCEVLREMKSSVEVRLKNWYGDGNEKNPIKKIRKQNIRLANKACSGRGGSLGNKTYSPLAIHRQRRLRRNPPAANANR